MLESSATYRQLIVCKKTASEVVAYDNFDESQGTLRALWLEIRKRECTEAKRRGDSAKSNQKGAQDGKEETSDPNRAGRRMRREGAPDGDGRYSDRARRPHRLRDRM